MIRLRFVGIAPLQGIRNSLGDGASQTSVGVPPHKPVMFSGCADGSLSVLVYFGTVMFFESVLLLGLHIASANRDGIEFIRTDAPVQDFLAPSLGIEQPHSIPLNDWYSHGEVVISDHQDGAVRVFRIDSDRVFLPRLGGKLRRDVLVSDRVFRGDQIFTVRPQNLVQSSSIEGFCGLNQSVGGLLRRGERFLGWRRSPGCLLLRHCWQREKHSHQATEGRTQQAGKRFASKRHGAQLHLNFPIHACLPPPPTAATATATTTRTHAGGPARAAGASRAATGSAPKGVASRTPARPGRDAPVADAIATPSSAIAGPRAWSVTSAIPTCSTVPCPSTIISYPSTISCTATVIPYPSAISYAAPIIPYPPTVSSPVASAALLALPRICLAIGHGITSGGAAILIGGRPVGVGCAATMLRIVLPGVPTAISRIDAVAPLDVGVAIEIVIVVYGDVVVAAPPAAPTPAPGPHSSHGHSNAEGNCHSRSVVTRRRVSNRRVWVHGRAVDYRGVIARNVNNLGIGLLDHNDLFALHGLGLDLHLFG